MNDNSYNSDQILYSTNENIAVANVDDTMSFSQAFAAARAQVGPGGVFEWHGTVYGTFYANEWNAMSTAEHTQWQASIDYKEVYEISAAYDAQNNSVRTYPASEQEETGEIHVLGLYYETDYDGNIISYVEVEVDGEYGYVIDVDNDGVIDYVATDENGDGVVTDDEYVAVTDPQVTEAELLDQYITESYINGETPLAQDINTGEISELTENEFGGFDLNPIEEVGGYTASNEDMPDYTNEGNTDEWMA